MRITPKGQVTIPVSIREQLGLWPDTEVEFDVVEGCVRIRKSRASGGRGRELGEHLRGRATGKLTTDEIMALTRGCRLRR